MVSARGKRGRAARHDGASSGKTSRRLKEMRSGKALDGDGAPSRKGRGDCRVVPCTTQGKGGASTREEERASHERGVHEGRATRGSGGWMWKIGN
jgi:hypothetical protein